MCGRFGLAAGSHSNDTEFVDSFDTEEMGYIE
jgi:hypothetical protein